MDAPEPVIASNCGGVPVALASTLSGDLPCSRCGYLLEGLSVRDVCPECGLPITTTILAAVDPFAEELEPVRRPRLVAGALILWSAAALAAALWIWQMRAAGALSAAGAGVWSLSPVGLLILVALSGAGATVFVRPAHRWPRRATALAIAGALGYIPLLAGLWALHVEHDLGRAAPYLGAGIDERRHALRLVLGTIMASILIFLRPSARQMVGRSLRLRQGRVDRQTILAMLACIAVAAAGDLAMLGAGRTAGALGDILRVGGLALIGAGSALMTVGLAGTLVDSIRIARAIVAPAPSIRGVLTRPPPPTRPAQPEQPADG
ncbi:MAG: hypothetical protein ACF8R7_15795 [Phycisphaerales bacterium JB039]